MKRIGIFVFYDGEGEVDDYKIYLLDSLRTVLSDLIIVINGYIREDGLFRLRSYTNDILIRENKGFDGQAYRDVLINQYQDIDWELWDEIVLLNDTFYGPLFPWENVFTSMEKEDVDFWGLSRSAGGAKVMLDGSREPEYVHSYFLVIHRKMFISPYWREYWLNLAVPVSHREAVEKFEIPFTVWFHSKGFRYLTWLDKWGICYVKEAIINPDVEYSYDIIKYGKFPILKWRAMSVVNYKNAELVLQYIENDTDYDKRLIVEHLERMEKLGRFRPFGIAELENFVGSRHRLYIFGHGQYGKGVAEYFRIRGWELSGFVVSDPESDDEIALQDLTLGESDGLIVALCEKNINETKFVLKEKFREEQLLFPRI